LVRDALSFERGRNGQSFFVCPRIEDLEPMSERLREIVPQLRLVVVHGKLPPAEVDEAVVAFAEGRGDVLLSTNIIEAGLDIPRANTILVWRPDRFGAAQLHQLRGRVGRGRRRGLAYLLTDPDMELPPSAEKRLQTLTELDRLGAGFAVSRRDLDLRGAGDLLGEAQAGHIQAIGLELYRHLLDCILTEARTGKAVEDRMAEVKLGIPASIPPDYVAEPQVRINLYARLARLRDLSQIEELSDEIEDRFGPPPPATRNLLDLARIGNMARSLGIVQVDGGPLGIALTFAPGKTKSLRSDCAEEKDAHWSGDCLVLTRRSDTAERVNIVRRLLERFSRATGSGRLFADAACRV
jgi:transcription-repair coupling factor (superfamily II helicase)